MMQKAGLQEEDDEEDEEVDKEAPAWGKSKKLYYSANIVDFEIQSDDEEAPAEEEAEALRVQQKAVASLRPEDYEQDDEEEECDGGGDTLEKVVERKEEKSSKTVSNESTVIVVEGVEKGISALSKEEKMDVVMSDAPELVGLLTELREALDELKINFSPLLRRRRMASVQPKTG